jgi:hypothetical protein
MDRAYAPPGRARDRDRRWPGGGAGHEGRARHPDRRGGHHAGAPPMIAESVTAALGGGGHPGGADVVIVVPHGLEMAKKTLNHSARLDRGDLDPRDLGNRQAVLDCGVQSVHCQCHRGRGGGGTHRGGRDDRGQERGVARSTPSASGRSRRPRSSRRGTGSGSPWATAARNSWPRSTSPA